MKILKNFGLFFILVSIAMLLLSAYLFLSSALFVTQAKKSQGVVIDHKSERTLSTNNRYRTSYFPLIAWTTPEGKRHEFQSVYGSNPPKYDKGQSAELLYVEGPSLKVRINDFDALWSSSIIAFLTALGALGIGYLLGGTARLKEVLKIA